MRLKITPTILKSQMVLKRLRRQTSAIIPSKSSIKMETNTKGRCKTGSKMAGESIPINQGKNTQGASSMTRSMDMDGITSFRGLNTKETGAAA